MSDWYPCPVCKMAHPWRLTEKPCSNEEIVERTGLTGLAALKASGLFGKWDKPKAVNTDAVNSVNRADDVNTDAKAQRREYLREYMRKRRAGASEV
jgi:hypothetical protein